MIEITKLEDTVADWLKPIPHLPKTWQKWIAENIWWITLVGVILSVIGVLSLISAILTALSLFGATTGYYGSYITTRSYTGWWVLASVISLLFMVAIIAVTAMAINPLKSLQKKGWSLLFLALVISAMAAAVNIIINFNALSFIPSIIFCAIGVAISAYFLYEIRSYFNSDKTATSKK